MSLSLPEILKDKLLKFFFVHLSKLFPSSLLSDLYTNLFL